MAELTGRTDRAEQGSTEARRHARDAEDALEAMRREGAEPLGAAQGGMAGGVALVARFIPLLALTAVFVPGVATAYHLLGPGPGLRIGAPTSIYTKSIRHGFSASSPALATWATQTWTRCKGSTFTP